MGRRPPSMSRKEFLKKSSSALLAAGLVGPDASGADAARDARKRSVPLGRTGLEIFPIGFGATRTMEPSLMRAAAEAGMNFFDTGRSYSGGRNEEMVGEALAGRRGKVVVQSKLELRLPPGSGAGPAPAELRRVTGEMGRSLEASLRALGTDCIDILLIHNATDPALAHHEAVRAFFAGAKKAGKIRAHGFSSHGNQIAMLRAAARENFYDVVMVPYNHKGSYVHSNSGRSDAWDQAELEAAIGQARERGIGVVAMKTCSGGPRPPAGGGKPDFTSALAWILERGRVDGMAVAMANFQQIREDLEAYT